MSAENKKVVSLDEIQSSKQTVDKSRRSFAKTGALVAPIIMSFASRPSWGQDPKCTVSIAGSLHHQSHHPDEGGPGCTVNSPSTVTPGVFQGDGGSHNKRFSARIDKWATYGVGEYRDYLFASVFINDPHVRVKDINDPTLEEVIKADPKDLLSGPGNACINHYITAYLSAMSPILVFPYTASQITADWGVWHLYPILQALQATDLTVEEALKIVKAMS